MRDTSLTVLSVPPCADDADVGLRVRRASAPDGTGGGYDAGTERQDRLLACRRCHLLDRSRRDRHPKARRASGFPRVVTEREVARLLTARRDQRGLEHEHLGREARRHGAPATDVRELALVSAGPNVDPAWSPDGTKIAFDTLTDDAWKSEI